MKYDILVTNIVNPRAQNIVARHLCSELSISMQKALSLCENLPFPYAYGVTGDEAAAHINQLKKIGVAAKRIEVQMAPLGELNTPLFNGKQGLPAQPTYTYTTVSVPQATTAPDIPPLAHTKEIMGIQSIHNTPSPKRRYVLFIAAGACLLVGAVIFGNRHSFQLQKAGFSSSPVSTSNGNGQNAQTKKQLTKRTATSPFQKKQSSEFVDSARSSTTPLSAIKFYQLAISLNTYNVSAWYGLIGAYNDAAMPDKAKKTEDEMKMMFGKDVFDVRSVVARYGDLVDVENNDGTFRIEYKTKTTDADGLVDEVYQMAKELHLVCDCSALSIYANTGSRGGILVFAATTPFAQGADEFRQKATITLLK